MDIQLIINNKKTQFDVAPICCGKIKLSYYRSGAPSALEFSVARDIAESVFPFYEGSTVAFTVDGVNMFYGYVFTKTRTKEQIISVKAYDQLRYLKNKDTYIYYGKTCSGLVRLIADDFKLKTGEIEESGYVLPDRIESNTTLFDIILTGIDLTKKATGKEFILYDDFGKLCFKDTNNMTLPLLAKEEMQGLMDFTLTTSIDSDTYNRVKLFIGHEEDICYMAEDGESIDEWGVLQYTDVLTRKELLSGAAFDELARSILKAKNRRGRSIILEDLGDPTVRGGSRIWLSLSGDENIAKTVVVDRAIHTFENGLHKMSLSLNDP